MGRLILAAAASLFFDSATAHDRIDQHRIRDAAAPDAAVVLAMGPVSAPQKRSCDSSADLPPVCVQHSGAPVRRSKAIRN
jgi:hypothetical protein